MNTLSSEDWRRALERERDAGRREGEAWLAQIRAAAGVITPPLSPLNPGADGSANGKHAPIATMNAAPGSTSIT